MKVGDHVLTYNKTDREYLVGEITSEYFYDPEQVSHDYSHIRSVDWQHQESRDAFPTPVKNTLGSTLTVFSVTERWDAINSVLTGEDTETETEVEESGPAYIEDVESQADELISDILANMDPFDFEELVAAVLRAMGYEATKTRDSHDHGVDVVAHPDAFGFEEPFLKVQVKRQKGTVGGPTMREFTGTLHRGDKGLYVATGGYTASARRAARESAQRVKLVDRDEFIDLLIDHYDDIEPEYQALVPLRPVYIPTRDPPTRK
jgi:restriction system protein